MSTKWQVAFIDAGNCEICQKEVDCFRAINAAKVAYRELVHGDQEAVDKECVKIIIEKAGTRSEK